MDQAAVEYICSSVARATARVRQVFRTRTDAPEILNRFWCVQDLLTRLLEMAFENPGDFFSVQQKAYPSLISDVVDVMSLAAKKQFAQMPAVSQACESTNELLIRLVSLKATRPVSATMSDLAHGSQAKRH